MVVMKWIENILEKLGFFSAQPSTSSGGEFYAGGSIQTKKSREACELAIHAVFAQKKIALTVATEGEFRGKLGDSTEFTMTRGGSGAVPLLISAEIWDVDDSRRIGIFVEETVSIVGRVGIMAELSGINEKCQEAVEAMKDELLQLLSQHLSEPTN